MSSERKHIVWHELPVLSLPAIKMSNYQPMGLRFIGEKVQKSGNQHDTCYKYVLELF